MNKQMSCIWEAATEAKEICYEQAECFSPYYEIADVVETEKKGLKISYNSLYRYENVFDGLLSAEDGKQGWQQLLLDLGTHILVEQELKSGWTKKELRIRRIMKQLEQADYGELVKKQYDKLDSMQKHKLACCMAEQLSCGESVALYAKALIGLWESGVVYKNVDTPKTLLVYAGEKKTAEKENIAVLVEDIFLPLGYETRIFWETHFGVIGKKESLRYGQIELL